MSMSVCEVCCLVAHLRVQKVQKAQACGIVQACAVDPGSVATAIYRDSKMFSAQPLKWLIENLYAPPWDGAAAVVHAASVPSWGAPAQPAGQCSTPRLTTLCVS